MAQFYTFWFEAASQHTADICIHLYSTLERKVAPCKHLNLHLHLHLNLWLTDFDFEDKKGERAEVDVDYLNKEQLARVLYPFLSLQKIERKRRWFYTKKRGRGRGREFREKYYSLYLSFFSFLLYCFWCFPLISNKLRSLTSLQISLSL